MLTQFEITTSPISIILLYVNNLNVHVTLQYTTTVSPLRNYIAIIAIIASSLYCSHSLTHVDSLFAF